MKSLRFIAILLSLQTTLFAQTDFTALVNPFIGTGGHGHTFPGATMPFGMMQLSPDTRLEGWDGCGGYHYSDSAIYGFSHTHLSGTGVPDYCDVLLLPFTGEVKWKNKEYASPFSHANEKASPGYYEVLLDKHNIKAALTTSYRSGMHAYTFDAAATEGKILLDLKHRDEVLESSLEIVNEYEVKGLRRSKYWAKDQYVYFYIRFQQPIKEYGIALNDTLVKKLDKAAGKNIKSYFTFSLGDNKTVQLKIGISGVSAENAKLNLDTEIPAWDFNLVKKNAAAAWNKELGKIEIKGGTHDQQVSFYTALYHTMIAPNIYTDVNGEYRGTDLKVHKADGFTNYTVFSLWDTYRSLHPLMSIINRERTKDWINTFLNQYKNGGMMPVWELSGNETFCMIGYHSVPVIADAYRNGIRDFDTKLALKAMTDYAESHRYGLPAYMKQGFVSNDDDHESASKTMEYAYDDWCIAQFAKWTGNDSVYQIYRNRALQYRNLFDPRTKHIRGKVQGAWYAPFEATEINNFFTEGNSWHYSFATQQDFDGLKKLYGGSEAFAKKLNELFTTTSKLSGKELVDVTGLIGQYAHGNEPSHHMAYLFNYAGKPWRTQELIHQICSEFYPNNPDGLIGNEDCGQMSAWYIFSAMGFYPVSPGSGDYAIGTPQFDEVTIHLENGKRFVIKAKNRQQNNFYVNSVRINEMRRLWSFIDYETIANGGEMVFDMSDKPNKVWATKEADMPHIAVDDSKFTAVPFFDMETYKFEKTGIIKFGHISNAAVYYSIEESGKPAIAFTRYTKPFTISRTVVIKAYAEQRGIKSPVVQRKFYKMPADKNINIISQVNPMYTAGGKEALIDGIIGNEKWRAGDWQSYYGKTFEAIIDLKTVKPITYTGIHVLQDVNPWIIYPREVQFEISDDGKTFAPLATVKNTVTTDTHGPVHQMLGAEVNTKARYIRIKAFNGGTLPAWHEGAGSPSHLFIDEVVIK